MRPILAISRTALNGVAEALFTDGVTTTMYCVQCVHGDALLCLFGERAMHSYLESVVSIALRHISDPCGLYYEESTGHVFILAGASRVSEHMVQRLITEVGSVLESEAESFLPYIVRIGIDPTTTSSPTTECARLALDHGHGQVEVYDQHVRATTLRTLQIARGMQIARMCGGFFLHYQPIIDLVTQAVAGYEALLRIQSATLGVLQPMQFIPIAHASIMTHSLGEWTIREVFRQLASWKSIGYDAPRVAINIPGGDFTNDLLLPIQEASHAFGVAPSMIEIEITEAVAVQSLAVARSTIGRLADIGIGVSVDDFGMGYSSLGHITDLDGIRSIKVDKNIVQRSTGAATCRHSCTMRHIIDMAHAWDKNIIAEGIETEDQRRFVATAGCDRGQGYLFAHPLPPTEVPAFALRHTHVH